MKLYKLQIIMEEPIGVINQLLLHQLILELLFSFLAVLALYHDKRKIKYVFLDKCNFDFIVISWGKNFSLLTDFFIDYVPMYNKFRAVSSIQVVIGIMFASISYFGITFIFY